jgi:hypothetical protein
MITVNKDASNKLVYEIVKQTANGTAYAESSATDLSPNNLFIESSAPKVTSDSLGMRRSRIKLQLRDSVKTSTCADADCELKHTTVEVSTSFPVMGDAKKLQELLFAVAQMLTDNDFVTSALVNGRTQYSSALTVTPTTA